MERISEIMIIDDNIGDANLLLEAFNIASSQCHLTAIKNGIDALSSLRKQDRGGKLPDMIVLDLKMPHMDGFTFMKEIMQYPSLSEILIIVLTGSDDGTDREMAFSLGAGHYFIKPGRFDGWIKLAKTLESLALKEVS